MKALLGKKVGMTQIFHADGRVFPVTLIEAAPCTVVRIRTKDKDGYEAVQLGLLGKKGKYKLLREFRNGLDVEPGQEVSVSIFQEGDKVKISGISKGKGFQGAVKRHGFSGRNATHGVKHEHRTLGSVGSRFPQRVVKGRRMPGHMGAERVTVKNLEIVKIDAENNLLAVKGALPGAKGTLLEIRLL
ncbi:MAG TPA: 50S ribosomal protein L3 [Candidatus Paceibacterota bacterium]